MCTIPSTYKYTSSSTQTNTIQTYTTMDAPISSASDLLKDPEWVPSCKPKLIIEPHIAKILALIDANLVVQINAPTGSGKSIGIPKALSESGKRVFSSVPTRVSAMSLCSYLRTLNPKIRVGYAAEGNSMYDQNSQVVYATSGHVRRKLLGYFSQGLKRSGLTFTDVLIVDETHSGSLDNTIILSLWMEAHRLEYRVPKLVLLSATPTDLPVKPEPVVYSVPVPTPFPVEIKYDPSDDDDSLYEHAADLVVSLHNDPHIVGDFLVFVPGSREVDELVAKLSEEIPDAVVLPAYSTLDSDELKLIYTPTDGRRKIVVATNIAESSITIDGLVVVIDTLKCKEATASGSAAMRLETVTITKDSAKQRMGRVGRTRPGTCYRLISESEYETIEDHRTPEIERVPLHNTVMEFLQANIDPVKVICGISPDRVIESIELLTRLGMLEKKGDSHVVTNCGHFAPSVPLGVRNAAFLWRWIQAGIPVYPGIVIACIIDVHSNGYFYIPRKKNQQTPFEYNLFCQEFIQETFHKWIGETPLNTYLNMWSAFTRQTGRNHYRLISEPGSQNYRRWSRDNSMNYKQLSELVSITAQTYRVVRGYFRRADVNVYLFDAAADMKRALPILQDIYHDNTLEALCSGDMYDPRTGLKHVYDNRRIISTIERTQPSRVIPLATHEIVTRAGRPLGYIDLCIPALPKPVLHSDYDSDDE